MVLGSELPEPNTPVSILSVDKTKNEDERANLRNRVARNVLASQRDKHESFAFRYAGRLLQRITDHVWQGAWHRANATPTVLSAAAFRAAGMHCAAAHC